MVGGKATGLSALLSLDLQVPRTYVVSAKARHDYGLRRKRSRLLSKLKRELSLIDLPSSYGVAVRSSAAGEDGAHASLAGQYESRLYVRGIDQIVAAIRSVWTSGGGASSEGMEVLLQEMVQPVASGASFSRNPVTGADEVIVEGVKGTSVSLLQGGETPRRWTIRGSVPASDWGPLPTSILKVIAEKTRRVAKELRYPADLEWAFDGKTLWWLQVRPITSLRGLPVYSNRISREYLPGLVKPLVWSINVPMINGAWVDLFERVVGPLAIDPLTLARQFHYRAYFNMSGMGELFRKLGLPGDALEQVFGLVAASGRSPLGFRWKMLRHLPRVVRLLVSVSLFHLHLARWEVAMTERLEHAAQELDSIHELSEAIGWVDAFLPVMREASQTRILSLLLHLIAGQMRHRAPGRRGLDLKPEQELTDSRIEAYDPSAALRKLAKVVAAVPAEERAAINSVPLDALLERPPWGWVKGELGLFLEHFGHLSESGNDFSAPSWSEQPLALLRLAASSGPNGLAPGSDPRGRDGRASRSDRRVALRRLDRERVGAMTSRGFHLLRRWALRCGGLLVASGALREPGDVFLLSLDELRAVAERGANRGGIQGVAAERRRVMRDAESRTLPETILGGSAPEERPDFAAGETHLNGIGTSRGTYEGRACAIRSMEAFGDFEAGDVLVVPFSDIAWTPLFARAGAIVAEAGGLLSHSSIVAREAGIPAVVSVPNACDLLDGKIVAVDGLLGRVSVLSGED